MTNQHVCPTCHTLQPLGDGYCDQCGTPVIPTRFCDSCGVMAAHNSQFCRECGTKLPPITPPPPILKVSAVASPPPAVHQSPSNLAPVPAPLVHHAPLSIHTTLSPPTPPTFSEQSAMVIALIIGAVGVVMMASNSVFSIILFMVMFAIGGKRLRETAASGMEYVIDWIWEDAVLRRRLLKE